MRTAPTLLIARRRQTGGRWKFQAKWRFQFVRKADMHVAIQWIRPIREIAWSIGDKDRWVLAGTIMRDGPPAGFAIPSPGDWALAGAGLKQFGTEAAGHVLTDPEQLGGLLAEAGSRVGTGEERLVLHAQVIGNTPAQPELVASHVW